MSILRISDCQLTKTGVMRAGTGAKSVSRTFKLSVPELNLSSGSCVAVVGPSGSGKSTLLEMLALLRAPNQSNAFQMTEKSGSIINVQNLWRHRQRSKLSKIRARSYGIVSASGRLFPAVSIRKYAQYRAHLAGMKRRQSSAQIAVLAEQLEISHLLDLRSDQLSRGEAIRGSILQSLVHKPKLIIADEPTASLHPSLAANLFRLLARIVIENGGAVIVATHDSITAQKSGFQLLEAQMQGEPNNLFTSFESSGWMV